MILGKIAAIICGFVWNFILYRRVVFIGDSPKPADPSDLEPNPPNETTV